MILRHNQSADTTCVYQHFIYYYSCISMHKSTVVEFFSFLVIVNHRTSVWTASPASPCNSESNQSMTTFIYPGNRIPNLWPPQVLRSHISTKFPSSAYMSVIYSSPSGYNTKKYNQPHAAFAKHCLETYLGSPDKTYVIPYAIIYKYAALPAYAYLCYGIWSTINIAYRESISK